ncbi:MAG TPA: ATP-grasp domain-containing protein [Myxococcales bacterium]|nr:ATP-grasp domain-containing protein [Myxococcales bacterium]
MANRGLRISVLYEPSDNVTPPEPPPRPRHAEKRRGGGRKRVKPSKTDREQVTDALRKNGHDAFLYELNGEKTLLELAKNDADLVFNLVEAYEGDDGKEPHVAAFLDLLGLRYTGAGPQALFVAQDKAMAKKLFSFHGIKTPQFATSYRGKIDHMDDLGFPLIVKPASEDGSVGIDCGSVVNSVRELMERIELIQERFDSPALIEEFIDGREIYVGVLGNGSPEALPPVELDLSKLPKGMPRIAGKEVKWEKGTEAYDLTRSAVARDLPDELRTRIQGTALAAYAALGLRDYGRIDLRVTARQEIYVIEANPNPWLAPEAELAIAAAAANRDYPRLIGEIADRALARYS